MYGASVPTINKQTIANLDHLDFPCSGKNSNEQKWIWIRQLCMTHAAAPYWLTAPFCVIHTFNQWAVEGSQSPVRLYLSGKPGHLRLLGQNATSPPQ